MTIVDVATDRIGLGQRFVHVHEAAAMTGGDKLVLSNVAAGLYQRLVAGVFSADADCVFGFTTGTGDPRVYEMRANVPLVLPFDPAGHHATEFAGNSWRIYCDTTCNVYANAVLATQGTVGAGVDRYVDATAEHLGGPIHHLALSNPATTEETALAAVSGKALRVLWAQLGVNTNPALGELRSNSTPIFKARLGHPSSPVVLPFNPVGWCTTNVGEALRVYHDAGSRFDVDLLVQEVAAA